MFYAAAEKRQGDMYCCVVYSLSFCLLWSYATSNPIWLREVIQEREHHRRVCWKL